MKEIALICLNLDQVRITVDSLLMDTLVKRTPRVSHYLYILLFYSL